MLYLNLLVKMHGEVSILSKVRWNSPKAGWRALWWLQQGCRKALLTMQSSLKGFSRPVNSGSRAWAHYDLFQISKGLSLTRILGSSRSSKSTSQQPVRKSKILTICTVRNLFIVAMWIRSHLCKGQAELYLGLWYDEASKEIEETATDSDVSRCERLIFSKVITDHVTGLFWKPAWWEWGSCR